MFSLDKLQGGFFENKAHVAFGLFYLFGLIAILILIGNVMKKSTKDKILGWILFSVCLIAGLVAATLSVHFAASQSRTIAVVVVANTLIAGLLAFGMIYTGPDVELSEKVAAHSMNLLFLIVSISSIVLIRNT